MCRVLTEPFSGKILLAFSEPPCAQWNPLARAALCLSLNPFPVRALAAALCTSVSAYSSEVEIDGIAEAPIQVGPVISMTGYTL